LETPFLSLDVLLQLELMPANNSIAIQTLGLVWSTTPVLAPKMVIVTTRMDAPTTNVSLPDQLLTARTLQLIVSLHFPMEDVLKELSIPPPMQLDMTSMLILLTFPTILLMETETRLQLHLSIATNLLVMEEFQVLTNASLCPTPLTNANVPKLLALPLLAKTTFANPTDKLQDGINFLPLAFLDMFQTATLETSARTNTATLLGLIRILQL
jgi:hypothetical protein